MKIFNIIPYLGNLKTGETIEIKNWLYLRVGESYNEVYEWALKNKYNLIPDYSIVNINFDNDTLDLIFDVVVSEVKDLMITDLSNNKYRVGLDLVSKIEIQYVEVPIEKEYYIKDNDQSEYDKDNDQSEYDKDSDQSEYDKDSDQLEYDKDSDQLESNNDIQIND